MSVQSWEALWECASECKKGSSVDLSKEKMPSSACHNTITVTGSGAVIIRLAWKTPAEWDEDVASSVLNACNVVSLVLENCC